MPQTSQSCLLCCVFVRWLAFGGAMTSNVAAASRGVLAKVRSLGVPGIVMRMQRKREGGQQFPCRGVVCLPYCNYCGLLEQYHMHS